MNLVSRVLIACTALGVLIYTALSAAGVVPWLSFSLTFGETTYPQAGQVAQIAGTVLMIMFASFLPAVSRVTVLENSHRKFHMKMEDVAQAYYRCHAADRSGVFETSSEFDAVRERLAYMRDHPELSSLEPDVLEVAAQMSQVSQEIASVYSEENIGRARVFLRQRHEEIQSQKKQIAEAHRACEEIEKWADQLNAEGHIALNEQASVETRLRAVLPKLGLEVAEASNVHALSARIAGE